MKYFIPCFLSILLWVDCAVAQEKDGLFNFGNKSENSLDQRWELTPKTRGNTFTISPYKPVYIMPVRYSSSVNNQPSSANLENVSPQSSAYENWEVKFQLSLKAKVAQGLLWGKGDIWLAFTQTANWQIFNGAISRPFRELNYEPEVLFNYPLNWTIDDFTIKMAGLGLNHQSNGKSLPQSRSWNRVIAHVAMQYRDWSFMLRPWWRIPEDASTNDNPGIEDYVGRGELVGVYSKKGHMVTLMLRSNLRFNNHYKGYTEFTYTYPIKNDLKAFITFSNGYGDTLIDFNHNQTNIGLGVSLIEWL